MCKSSPTPYPDINAILNTLLSSVQSILANKLIGMYLYGSLASGDFNPQSSDIDFVVVTADAISDEVFSTLQAMHARLSASDSKWATRLEGDYIPLRQLRRYDPMNARYPHLGTDGHFDVEHHASDGIIQRYILREQGIVVAGTNPKDLIDPIQPKELRRATSETLREWWLPMLDNPIRLQSGEYQAYAILTMCRALYTLQYGAIGSKPVAAKWAQEMLGERWAMLIKQAVAWRDETQLFDMNETLELIRYTLERSKT